MPEVQELVALYYRPIYHLYLGLDIKAVIVGVIPSSLLF